MCILYVFSTDQDYLEVNMWRSRAQAAESRLTATE